MSRLRARWEGFEATTKLMVVIIITVVAVNLAGMASNVVFGGGASGRDWSSYGTVPRGTAAYAELLVDEGHQVERLRSNPSETDLDPGDSVVVLGANGLADNEAAALLAFVESGGRLILGVTDEAAWLGEIIDSSPIWIAAGTTRAEVIAPAPETRGVSQVRGAGRGAWSRPEGTLPVLGSDDLATVTVASPGRGRVVLLADPRFLTNDSLAHGDNAALALGIAGAPERTVLFAESFHGYTQATGFSAIPPRWKWSLSGLLVAVAAWLADRARRFGPPNQKARELAPPRRDFVSALAVTLARTGRREEAVAPVKEHARALLAQRSGLAADPSQESLERAAVDLDLPERIKTALFSPAGDDDDVIAAGRAMLFLSRGDK